jgi:ankyrin repeat protein
LRKALQNLPKTLDETYDRIISEIPEVYIEDTRRVLYWLCFSFEPLSISQISDALAVEQLQGDEVRFDPRNGLRQPAGDLLTMCGSLISLGTSRPDSRSQHTSERVTELRLSHFTVKEYLLSERSKALRLVKEDGDELLAQTCLAYLLYFEGRVPMNRQMNDTFPLAAYASRNWMKHHRRANRKDTDEMNDLLGRFAHSKAAILTAARLHDPSAARGGESSHFGQSLHMIAHPLYYMADAGILGQTRRMIEDGAAVNAVGGHFGTALQATAYNGDDLMVQLLIESGANVNQEAGLFSSALCAAIAAHSQSTVKILLATGADVNTSCSQPGRDILTYPDLFRSLAFEAQTHEAQNFSALQLACDSGDLQLARLLVDHAVKINATDGNGRSALHCASRRLHIDIMRYLLQNGALVDGGRKGRTPLQELVDLIGLGTEQGVKRLSAAIHILLQSGADLKRVSCYIAIESHYKNDEAPDHLVDSLLRLLIERGCNVEDISPFKGDCGKTTALHLAAQLGNERLTTLLLAAGVERATLDGDGRDSYFVAIGNGNVEVARLLKDERQATTFRDRYGQNPVFMTAFRDNKPVIELLQEQGYDMDAKDKNGHTPLWHATQNDDLAKARCLASLGCDLHTRDERGATLLHISTQHCPWLDLFRFLAENGLDVNEKDRNGLSPIHYLVEYCDEEHRYGHMVEGLKVLLANGANVNMQDNKGRTVAHLLARRVHQKLDDQILEVLLLADADLTLQDDANESPWEAWLKSPIPKGLDWLFSGAPQQVNFGIAKTWFALARSLEKEDLTDFEVNLARLPSVDFTGPNGATPLHFAAKKGRLDVVKLLVGRKANINSIVTEGLTPLHVHVLEFTLDPNTRIIKYLLQHGADVMLTFGNSNNTILHQRAELRTTVKNDLEIFRMLIEDAKVLVDINCQNGYGNTPLICAVGGPRNLPIVRYLCSKNADVLRSNLAGVTALGRAVILGELQMVEVLCKSGAAVNINSAQLLLSKQHYALPSDPEVLVPPLHAAAMTGNIKMIKYLLSQGADVHMLDVTGENVIHWAARGGQAKAAKFFMRYGADYTLKNHGGETPLDMCENVMRARLADSRAKRGWHYDPGVDDYLRFGIEGQSDDEEEEDEEDGGKQENDGEEFDEQRGFDNWSDRVEFSEREDD